MMKTKKMQRKRIGSAKRGILVKGKWKAVEIDPSIFAEEAMGEIVCFEELTDYSLVESKKISTVSKLLQQSSGKKKKNKRKASEIDAEEETFEEPITEDGVEDVDLGERPAKKQKKKKQKQKNSNDPIVPKLYKEENSEGQAPTGGLSKVTEGKEDQQPQDAESKNKKKKKKRQETATEQEVEADKKEDSVGKVILKSKKKVKNWTDSALSNSASQNTDVSAWKDLFVPPPVLEALSKLGFSAPTPIQALALPPAIRDHLDILGAAETGSGKTLSFGIPMIHYILEWKKSIQCKKTDAAGKSESVMEVESIFLPPSDTRAVTSAEDSSVLLNAEMEFVDETAEARDEDNDNDDCGSEADDQSQDIDIQSDEVMHVLDLKMDEQKEQDSEKQPLLGLVLTPTRELAVQVKHHIDAVAQFTGIKTAIVVGGMAQQKQDRMLKRKPEIVIATPGRLWEMIQEKHPHLRNLRQLRCLVIDEADRMVEKGHFAELENLLEMLNTSQYNPKRQTFVFSATLTMVHSMPSRLLRKKGKKVEQRSKLELLIERMGIKGKPKVIDLTRKEATVETLTETRIHCEKDEKDFYLYYFLLQYPGRTMVFANSIDCIKRLNSLLTILDCTPLPLHANMHQKQRLKNLERFAERESCVLLTTDVAARGLDIPDVQHVIHYQVPRTSETYVHRSGRTARATKEGLSLLLIGPDDMMNFKKIYRTLGKDEDLPVFPIQEKCMSSIKDRVDVARKIEKIEYHNSREKQHNAWFRQAAEEMDVDLDDDVLLGKGRNEEDERQQQKLLKGLKKHLRHLINQPVFKSHMKTKYPTQMGKLQLPQLPLASETALISVNNQKQKNKLQKKEKGKI